MSGRARHWRDGELITNRKTDRRQTRRTPEERIHSLNDLCRRRFQSKWKCDVRLGFLLPRDLEPFVASGPHGHAVNVHRGFVQVQGGSAEECFITAEHFFADVARGRPAFEVLAAITSSDHPGFRGTRYLVVVNGAMVVTNAANKPRIYEVPSGA
jgi:hypothetical protein